MLCCFLVSISISNALLFLAPELQLNISSILLTLCCVAGAKAEVLYAYLIHAVGSSEVGSWNLEHGCKLQTLKFYATQMEHQHTMTSLTQDILGNENQLLDLSGNMPTAHTLGANEVRMNKVFEMWAEPEVFILLDLYEEKWLENNRGNFASEHWKWIANEMRGRYKSSQGRTAVQCRSKIEKMRRKYRDEKRLFEQSGLPSRWEFFDRMAQLWRYRPKSHDSRDSADNMMQDLEIVMPKHPDFRERDAHTSNLFLDRETSISTPPRKVTREREIEDIDSAKPKGCGASSFAGRFNGKRTKKTRAMGELVEVMKSFAGRVLKIEESKMELLRDMAREQRESAREQRELAREQRESHERMITLVLQTIMSIQEIKHTSKRD